MTESAQPTVDSRATSRVKVNAVLSALREGLEIAERGLEALGIETVLMRSGGRIDEFLQSPTEADRSDSGNTKNPAGVDGTSTPALAASGNGQGSIANSQGAEDGNGQGSIANSQRAEDKEWWDVAGLVDDMEKLQARYVELVWDSLAWVFFSVTGRRMDAYESPFWEPEDLLEYDRAAYRRKVAMGVDEGREAVRRLYREILQREADENGLAHYQEELASGRLTYWGLRDRLLASDEAKAFAARALENGRKYLEERKQNTKPTTPTPPVDKEDKLPPAPQFLMAPHVRHLLTDDMMREWAQRAVEQGFTGLWSTLETAWFDPAVNLMSRLPKNASLNAAICERLHVLANICEAHGLALHLWVWGDEQNDLHPHNRFGKRSVQEREVYAFIKARFTHRAHVSWGIGFDVEEWMDDEYAAWIMQQLPGVRISMRHPTGRFDSIASIPSRMHRRPTESDFAELRRQWPVGMVMSEDRFRNRPYEPNNDGHIDLAYQARIWKWAERYGVSCIWGNFIEKQYRYELGTECYPYGWRNH